MRFGGNRLGFWFVNQWPATISWSTTQSGINPSPPFYGWSVNNSSPITSGLNYVRFNIQQSVNCGGTNNNTQLGTATGVINTGIKSWLLQVTISGNGEVAAAGFEELKVRLYGGAFGVGGTLMQIGTSPGGGTGCGLAPLFISNFNNPVTLEKFTEYTLLVDFTTKDELYNDGWVEMYYDFTEL